MTKIPNTLFLADDHPIFLEGLRRSIDKKRFAIIGDAVTGKEALEKILALNPDIAILDIFMPELTGICIARELGKRGKKTKIILLTSSDEQNHLDEALKLGVSGYILKNNTRQELTDALAYVQKGDTYISPLISARIMKIKGSAEQKGLALLTATEREILALLAKNKTSQEIASAIKCSPKTVQNHRHNICQKLELTGHNALLYFALTHKDLLNYGSSPK